MTKDLVSGNIIKKELVWQRVKEDARSKELGLITGNEDAEEEIKCKQRLTDKVAMKFAKSCEARKAVTQVETCLGKNIADRKETCSAIVNNSLCLFENIAPGQLRFLGLCKISSWIVYSIHNL